MKCTFDFSLAPREAAACIGVISASDFHDIAISIFHHIIHIVAFDDVGSFQTHFGTGCETEEFFRRVLHEVIALDIYFT